MKKHDPYKIILEEMRLTNDDSIGEDYETSILNKLKPYLHILRKAYEGSQKSTKGSESKRIIEQVDYSNRFQRAAYLLAYYPHHIEIPYHALRKVNHTNFDESFNKETITVTIIGGGPSPELLGTMQYLSEKFPNIQRMKAYVIDKYVNAWRVGQEITRYHLKPYYWEDRDLRLIPLEFDFMDETAIQKLIKYSQRDPDSSEPHEETYSPLRVKRALKCSNLIIMQNCINDFLPEERRLTENLANMLKMAERGTIIAIIDLGRIVIGQFLYTLETLIKDGNFGEIITGITVGNSEWFRTNIERNEQLKSALFEDNDGLRERANTYYYSLIFKKL